MLKSIILYIFLFPNLLFSQNVVIKYHFHFDGDDFVKKLIITDTISFWENEGRLSNSQEGGFLVKDDDIFLLKHFKNRKIYFRTFRIYQRSFFVEDSLFLMKWKITKESKQILGYKCKSATTTFRGRSYTAFYTEKIPIPDGPWKFGGLPGLILEIYSHDGICKWKAIEYIQNSNEKPRKNPDLSKIEFITWQAYVKNYKEHIYRVFEKKRAEAKPGTSGGMMIYEVEIYFPEFQTGKGLTW